MIKKGIFSISFNSFESNPLSARDLIKMFNSLDTYDIYEYEYYLVSDFDEQSGELNYYIIIPVSKKLSKVVSILSQTSDAKIVNENGTELLIIPLERDNELLSFIKRIEPVVKSYYAESQKQKFYVNVTPNDIVIDENNGNITIEYKNLDIKDPVISFVLFYEYFNMGKILFKVNDFLIVSTDGSILITRFKKVQTPKELPKSSILVEVSIPDVRPELKKDVIVHRVNILFEEIILMSEIYFAEVTKKVTEYLEKKNITNEQIQELIDALYDRKLSITTNIKKGKKLAMRVITPYGEIYTTSLLPEFAFETIIRAYYAELMKDILPIIKNMKPQPKVEKVKEEVQPKKTIEQPKVEKEESQTVKTEPQVKEKKEKEEIIEVKKKPKKKKKKKTKGLSFSLFGGTKKNEEKKENENKSVEVIEEVEESLSDAVEQFEQLTSEENEEEIEIITPENKDLLLNINKKEEDEDIEIEISLI